MSIPKLSRNYAILKGKKYSYKCKLLFKNFTVLFLTYIYWVVRKVRAAKDLNLINEIKNLNLLRFNFPSKSARTFRTNI